MKNLLRFLRSPDLIGRDSASLVPASKPESADKVVVQVNGGRVLRQSDIDELNYFRTMGRYHHEQLESFAASACQVIGVNPDAETMERDWCNEIVYHAQDPLNAINQINARREQLVNGGSDQVTR